MKAVQGALIEKPYIEALFWDYASLFQKPPGGERTNEEQEAFGRSLDVMADVYASAVGTTALQLKEIPPRPARFDGALCIFDLAADVDKSAVFAALERHGEIASCDLDHVPPIVRFGTHAAALAAKATILRGEEPLCQAADTLYNERSYDGRHDNENGRENDCGRGWCVAIRACTTFIA